MKPGSPFSRKNGFSLVEMAVVLAIFGLLLAGLLPALNGQRERQQIHETRRQLDDIQQALTGFATVNGRLPCPASAESNGEESPLGGGNCTHFHNGYVPAATLGITSANSRGQVADAWGNPIRYAVTSWSSANPAVSNVYTRADGMAAAGLSALSPNLLVCGTASGISASSCAPGASLTSAPGVPAVLYSTGKNGGHGGSGADEAANLDGNRTFVSHTPAPDTAANGEFDDIVIWLSNHILINRMVSAGKLP